MAYAQLSERDFAEVKPRTPAGSGQRAGAVAEQGTGGGALCCPFALHCIQCMVQSGLLFDLNLRGEVSRMLLMTLLGFCRRTSWVAAALMLSVIAMQAEKHEADPGATLAPTARIAVAPLGYAAPSSAYLSYRMALTSLDFIDNDHLLFTFHRNGLMQRMPDDPADDEDQVIRAEVLEIATGKLLRQTEWRMHDRQRYLWALRDGKFLVRERNTLFFTDSNLELRPYLTFDTAIQAVEVSPARKLIMLEMEKRDDTAAGADGPPSLEDGGAQRRHTEIVLLHPGERQVLATGQIRNPVVFPLLEDGFLDVVEDKQPNEWLVEKKPAQPSDKMPEQNVGFVKSACTPEMVPVSESVALIEGCPPNGAGGNAVTAMSLAGSVLWQGLWQSKYVWGTFDVAENGSRFAYGSLEMNRPIGVMDSFGEADVVSQPVGVFDTETGKLLLVRNATPILSGGRNFALSEDGRRFAILRAGAIEVYDLPPLK